LLLLVFTVVVGIFTVAVVELVSTSCISTDLSFSETIFTGADNIESLSIGAALLTHFFSFFLLCFGASGMVVCGCEARLSLDF